MAIKGIREFEKKNKLGLKGKKICICRLKTKYDDRKKAVNLLLIDNGE